MNRKKMTKTRRGCKAQEQSDLFAIFDDEHNKWGDSVGTHGVGTKNIFMEKRTEWKTALQRTDIEACLYTHFCLL
jgi:hypothetical protein